jgi:drug/metabolite transporter (DMT)-like permease
MIQMLLVAAAFWAAQTVATRRGRRSPLWGFLAAALAYAGQIALLARWPATPGAFHWPSLWGIITLPSLLAAAVVAVVLLALPAVNRRTAEKRTWIPYRPLGWLLAAFAGVLVVVILVDLFTQPYDYLNPPTVPPAFFVQFGLLVHPSGSFDAYHAARGLP